MITIRETTKSDLPKLKELWADGDVMKFVGFPDGLHETEEGMNGWFEWIASSRPTTNHYSIYEDEVYCGETFFEIDRDHKSAAMDIKLFKFARGRGIAAKALSFAIEAAFQNGAETVWVDPDPQNGKAVSLYKRLGFEYAPMPEHLLSEHEEYCSDYMELSRKR